MLLAANADVERATVLIELPVRLEKATFLATTEEAVSTVVLMELPIMVENK